jgi:hypothetical protein
MFGAWIDQVIQQVPCLKKRYGYINKVKDGLDADLVINRHVHDHYKVTGKKEKFTIAPFDYKTPPNKFEGSLPATEMNELYMQTVRHKLNTGVRQVTVKRETKILRRDITADMEEIDFLQLEN